MPRPLSLLTPRTVTVIARGVSVVGVLLVPPIYMEQALGIEYAAALAYLLLTTLLVAFPGVRSDDLAKATAVLLTSAELIGAISTGHIDLMRWSLAMMAIGAAILPVRAHRVRTLAIVHPYRSFAESDRRVRQRADDARALSPAVAPARAIIDQ